jgi:hypothetical protein
MGASVGGCQTRPAPGQFASWRERDPRAGRPGAGTPQSGAGREEGLRAIAGEAEGLEERPGEALKGRAER